MNHIFWTNCFIGLLSSWLQGTFITAVMSVRFKKIPRAALTFLFTAGVAVPLYFRMTNIGTELFSIMGYLQLAITVIYVFVFFIDIWWKKVLVLVLVHGNMAFSEMIVIAFIVKKGVKYNPDFYTREMTIQQCLETIISCILLIIIEMFWKKVFAHEHIIHNFGLGLLLLLLPLSQTVVIGVLNTKMFTSADTILDQTIVFEIVCSVVVDIIYFYFIHSYIENNQMKQQIGELQSLYKVEQEHFSELERQDRTVAKIRHDMRNELTVISTLIDNGEYGQGREMIDQLVDGVRATSEGRWCENHIVNAVISEKKMICDEKDISIDICVEAGALKAIMPVNLCSIFSNMLDNAIEAVDRCGGDESQRKIRVSSLGTGEYFRVKVENTSLVHPGIHKRALITDEHGHGIDILKDLAQKYNGSYLTEWKDGIYTALMVLDVSEEKNAF